MYPGARWQCFMAKMTMPPSSQQGQQLAVNQRVGFGGVVMDTDAEECSIR